jgi:hypothetical protein
MESCGVAAANFDRGSEPLLKREGKQLLFNRKEGRRVTSQRSIGANAVIKRGDRRKVLIIRTNAQVDLAAAQHLLSPFFGEKYLCDYRL